MVYGLIRLSSVLILLLTGCWACVCQGASRPSKPESVLAERGGMDALLRNPVTNMALLTVVLKGPGPATLAARDAILSANTNGQDLAGQAALCYLAGEALYWGTFDRLRFGGIKTNQVLQIPRAEVISKYLDAWHCACQMTTNGGTRMRQTVANRMKTLLASATFGAALPQEMKMRVVHGFIDEMEKQKDISVSWSCEQKAGIYANLGIAQRLPQQIPLELPEGREALQKALSLAMAMHQPTQAVRFASALESRYAGHLRCDSNLWYQVYRAYREAGDLRALSCLRNLAERNPNRYLELYDLSVKMSTNNSESTMQQYLKLYLKSVGDQGAGRGGAVCAVAQRMYSSGRYEESLALMEQNYSTNCFWDITLTRIRGQCYEKLGRTNEAIAIYTDSEWYERPDLRQSHDAMFCLERMKCLGVEVMQRAKDR